MNICVMTQFLLIGLGKVEKKLQKLPAQFQKKVSLCFGWLLLECDAVEELSCHDHIPPV